MAIEVVPLKVQINLGPHGALYPEFNRLRIVSQSGLDWSQYIDQFSPWIYDSVSGHRQATEDSELGMQWGMLLVPEEFAKEADERWSTCHLMTAEEAHEFFRARHAYRIPRLTRSVEDMQAVKLEVELHELLEKNATTEAERETHRRRKVKALGDAAKAVDASSTDAGVVFTRSASLRAVLDERGLRLKGEVDVS